MRKILAVLMVLLTACASQPSGAVLAYKQYIDQNKPLAKSGAIKWSDYFLGVYQRAAAAGAPGRALSNMNDMIAQAKRYEAGEITKDQFDHLGREMQANERDRETSERAQSLAVAAEQQNLGVQQFAAGMALIQASQPQPYYQAPPQPIRSPTGGSPLKSSTYSNGMRYCSYYNGVVNTISNSYNCPNTSP